MKKFYRISPALSGGKDAWHVEHVTQQDGCPSSNRSVGYFTTLKRAKGVVAHFRKKPIEIPTR